jgi:hypothetical protein
VDYVHVWAFPVTGSPATFLGVPAYGRPRPDVAAIFGSQYANSGFRLDGVLLPPGAYYVVAYAHSTVTNSFAISRTADLTVTAPVSAPLMSLDTPQTNASVIQPFITAGWAVDLGATSGSGVDVVHVWAFPLVNGAPDAAHALFLGQATPAGSRPDVGAIYGSQFTNSGFTLIIVGLPPGPPPGTYLLGVYAHSTVSGSFNQRSSSP